MGTFSWYTNTLQLHPINTLCTQVTNTRHGWHNGAECRYGIVHPVCLLFEDSIPTVLVFIFHWIMLPTYAPRLVLSLDNYCDKHINFCFQICVTQVGISVSTDSLPQHFLCLLWLFWLQLVLWGVSKVKKVSKYHNLRVNCHNDCHSFLEGWQLHKWGYSHLSVCLPTQLTLELNQKLKHAQVQGVYTKENYLCKNLGVKDGGEQFARRGRIFGNLWYNH